MARVFWALAGATLALYLVMVLWALPHLADLAGGQAMFDMRPGGYDFDTARAILVALGREGRDFYLTVQQRLDTLFPVFEALTLALAYQRLFAHRIALALSPLAVLGALFDYLENHAVAGLLRAGAEGVSAEMVTQASRWSQLKSGFVTLAMTALLLGLVAAGWRRWVNRAPG